MPGGGRRGPPPSYMITVARFDGQFRIFLEPQSGSAIGGLIGIALGGLVPLWLLHDLLTGQLQVRGSRTLTWQATPANWAFWCFLDSFFLIVVVLSAVTFVRSQLVPQAIVIRQDTITLPPLLCGTFFPGRLSTFKRQGLAHLRVESRPRLSQALLFDENGKTRRIGRHVSSRNVSELYELLMREVPEFRGNPHTA